MGLFDGSGDPSGGMGLMGMYANPQMAGLLGMSQGLLSAAGPSRIPVSMGQAMGAGLQGMQQNAGNALQMQQQMLRMQAMQGLMGGGQQQPAQGPQGPTGAPVMGSANVGGLSGPSAGMGAYAGSGMGGSAAGSSAAGAPAPTGGIYGKTPQQLFQQGMLMNMAGIQGGGDLMRIAVEHDPTLAYAMPTDSMKNMAAAYGQGTPEFNSAMKGLASKDMLTTIRPGGGVFNSMTGQTTMTPGANGVMQVQDPTSPTGWRTMLNPGATSAISQESSAKAGGQAQYALKQVWDPTANNGQGGFVQQTVANVANAANGGGNVPVGIRNNNFGNIKGADGQFQQYDTPQAGINAADATLAAYGAKHGINTITGIANRWAPTGDGNNNPTAKAAAMSAASGVGVNDPINLADPATRARILPALFDTETPGWRNAMGGGAAAPKATSGGPMASQPPLGQTNAANASQGAPSKQMADAYSGLSTADANYQQSREALTEMMNLANNKGVGGAVAGVLPESVSTKISPDAATYQKAHATYVALQGKSLGSGGTDAARATIDEAVPTYDKPQSAMVTGLTNQLNNLDMSHLKTQFLTPTYQQGNEKAFTQQSAAFDQNIKPTMMPILQMSGDQQRAAVQAAVKQNPAMRANFEWAFNNGLLK